MKKIKRIWRYFFPSRKVEGFEWKGRVQPQSEKPTEYHEVLFCEPDSPKMKFEESNDLSDYLNKINLK